MHSIAYSRENHAMRFFSKLTHIINQSKIVILSALYLLYYFILFIAKKKKKNLIDIFETFVYITLDYM